MIISSQKYLDEETVDAKLAASDFIVHVATIEHDGETYQIVVDGHHSLAAAQEAGVSPEFVESSYNYQGEVDCLGFDGFLEAHFIDSAWYDVETRCDVW